jgi:hypothetical protein
MVARGALDASQTTLIVREGKRQRVRARQSGERQSNAMPNERRDGAARRQPQYATPSATQHQ